MEEAADRVVPTIAIPSPTLAGLLSAIEAVLAGAAAFIGCQVAVALTEKGLSSCPLGFWAQFVALFGPLPAAIVSCILGLRQLRMATLCRSVVWGVATGAVGVVLWWRTIQSPRWWFDDSWVTATAFAVLAIGCAASARFALCRSGLTIGRARAVAWPAGVICASLLYRYREPLWVWTVDMDPDPGLEAVFPDFVYGSLCAASVALLTCVAAFLWECAWVRAAALGRRVLDRNAADVAGDDDP